MIFTGTATPGKTGKHGFISEGTTGYCYPSPGVGLVPLYRYYKAYPADDHFYSTDPNEIGTIVYGQVGHNGFKNYGITCYVYADGIKGKYAIKNT